MKIVHADMKGRTAEITVSFAAKYISTTSKEDGAVVEGVPRMCATSPCGLARPVHAIPKLDADRHLRRRL